MVTKLLEIRDRGTEISALAIRLDAVDEAERYLLARAGYGETVERQREFVLLLRLNGGSGEYHSSPWDWSLADGRTMRHAQTYVTDHFDELQSGQVVDVEYLLEETAAPKVSGRFYVRTA
jgi:hypothetical protein